LTFEPGGSQEAELVARLREGSRSAFEALYVQHGGKMRSLALSLMGNVSDAEDAVQEAFLKLHRGAASFEGRAALSTWIHRVVVNTCLDMKRRHKRRREDAADDLPESGFRETAEPGVDPALLIALRNALGRLDDRRRTVFTLFETFGFRHREIGEILGVSEGTSKSLLFEAKRELKQMFEVESGSAVESSR
jgi:RNA polymerase sigma-70 factor (ECF subfamily)